MQNRYIGDIHDFYKFIFLKSLSKSINEKVGLNWYLNDPSKIGEKEIKLNDGENRKYLNTDNYRKIDEEISQEMLLLKNKKNRILENFTKKSHLKKFIHFFNEELNVDNRKTWFSQSINKFKSTNIIFLDPDNGLIPKKVSKKRKVKYLFHQEIKKLYLKKKSIIFCQFQSFNLKHQIMIERKILDIYHKTKLKVNCPVIRNRSSPNTFFIPIIQEEYKNKVKNFLKDYVKHLDKVDLINF